MNRDWVRLGAAVEAARRGLGWTQDELARRAEVSLSTIQAIERGGRTKPSVLPTHRIVARTLDWTDESLDAVLAGGEPALVSRRPSDAPLLASGQQPSPIEEGVGDLLDDLTARVKGALLGGQVADATAVPMGEGSVVLIWKAGAEQELTPAQQRELEKKWSRIQRAAQNILADDEEQEE